MRIYFCAPVRGRAGNDVTYEDKWRNIMKAREIAGTIRSWYPLMEYYIPHDREEHWEESGLSSREILDACMDEVRESEILLCFAADGISSGMAEEIQVAEEHGIPVVYLYEWLIEKADFQKQRIARCLAEAEAE